VTRSRYIPVLAVVAGLGVAALILSGAGHRAQAGELPTVAQDMANAFAVSPTPDAQLPDAVRQAREYLPNPLPNQTRRIAHGLGKNGADMYVFPTTQGTVCEVITESTSMGSCVPSFRLVKGEVATDTYYGAPRRKR